MTPYPPPHDSTFPSLAGLEKASSQSRPAGIPQSPCIPLRPAAGLSSLRESLGTGDENDL